MLTREDLENLITKLDEVIKKNNEVIELTGEIYPVEEPAPVSKTEWMCMWCIGVSSVAIASVIAFAIAFFS